METKRIKGESMSNITIGTLICVVYITTLIIANRLEKKEKEKERLELAKIYEKQAKVYKKICDLIEEILELQKEK